MEKQVEKNFVWVIKNLSPLKPKQCYSDPFLIAGSRWRIRALSKGTTFEFFYEYLGVTDCQSLTSTRRRHVTLRLTILNGLNEKYSIVSDAELYFDEESASCPYPAGSPPCSKLLAKDGGFLRGGALKLVLELVSLEVIGPTGGSDHFKAVSIIHKNDGAKSKDQLNKTQELMKEVIDVNGFQVLPSQVEYVRRIFERIPDFASKFRQKNRHLKSTYMNVLIGLTETLCQLPQELSDDDLNEASFALSYVASGGFKVDWLENKLNEVKAKKKKVDTGKARLHQLEEELQKLKVIMEKENADVLAANVPLSLDDLLKLS